MKIKVEGKVGETEDDRANKIILEVASKGMG